MKRRNPLPSQNELAALLDYDPMTGVFVWKARTGNAWFNSRFAGTRAGSRRAGYWRIEIDGSIYEAYRLAWKYMTGTDPVETIDHKNRNRADDRWENLREATHAQQKQNAPHFSRRGMPKGVTPNSGKFMARITVGGVRLCLGHFSSPDEAHVAYRKAATLHFGEFAMGD